jgi:uncharacterized membrane protein HdeD (DUF308 family)
VRIQLIKPRRSDLAERWKWMRGVGAGFLIVGAGAVSAAVLVPAGALAAPLGWALIGLAVAYGAGALALTSSPTLGLQLVLVLAYALWGVSLLLDPDLGPLLLLVAMAGTFVLGGAAQAIAAVLKPHAQARWEALCGLILVAVGAMVGSQWPLSGTPALCVAFGLAAAAQGAAYLRLSAAGARLAARPPHQRNLFGRRKNPSTRQPSGARAVWRLPFGRQT